jgi:hypothetical protein
MVGVGITVGDLASTNKRRMFFSFTVWRAYFSSASEDMVILSPSSS